MKKRLQLLGILTAACLLIGCDKNAEKAAEVSVNPVNFAINSENLSEEKQEVMKIELPASYNYMKEKQMPVLRDQGNTNTCWAFAALSALESSKDEHGSGPYSIDHLLFHNPFGKKFENGGSYAVSLSYLLSWKGPVLEESDPFDGKSSDDLEPCVHVQEIRQSEPKDYEAIKRMVYLYGGVESALYIDFDQYLLDSSYYNRKYNSYCYPGEESSNHEIVIVGWDDHYPAENFLTEVSEDGAFLCLSSWGKEFGNAGTFYVSYEDVNIGNYGVVYSRIDPPDNYDRIYQSDLCGFMAQIGYQNETAWFANVYTPVEDISVKAAGFYATGKDTEYEIYVIPKFANEHSFMVKQFMCKGYLEDAGYYTIDFPESFEVDAACDFAIVVKLKTKDAKYPVAVECQVEGLSDDADLSDGRGYLSFQGNRWEWVEKTKNYNICLKAYGDLR